MIIDDEPALCAAWERVLGSESDMSFAGALRRADTLVEAISERHPDVVLLDVQLPGRDPFDVLADASASHPGTRVVMYSGHSDDVTINRAIDGGAWGMVDKIMPPRQILDIIRRVSRGEMCFPPFLPTHMHSA